MAEMSPLRRRMIEDMTIRNLSPATQRSYIHAVSKFSRYFGRSPDRLGLEDVRAFQVHLVSMGVSWPALNQTVCALRFFYGVTLGQGEIPERIAYAREPRKLPVVLNADEVVRFLEAVPSLKTRVALTTAYAAGLRASEAVSLKVADIDSVRMVIRVEHGKGGKDRTVMLSAQLLNILRAYWRLARPQRWLFPGRDEMKPIDVQVLHAAGPRRGRIGQARDRAYAAAFFRNPPFGERDRHPHHPGSPGPRQSFEHGALHQSLE
jgi:integrase/recombinase XerD